MLDLLILLYIYPSKANFKVRPDEVERQPAGPAQRKNVFREAIQPNHTNSGRRFLLITQCAFWFWPYTLFDPQGLGSSEHS